MSGSTTYSRLIMRWLVRTMILSGVAAASPSHASVFSELANSMTPGSWRQIPVSWPGGPNGFWRHSGNPGHDVAQFANAGVWDPIRRKMTFLGSGHGLTSHKYSKLVQYVESTDTWSSTPAPADILPDNVANVLHAWDHLAIDPIRSFMFTAHYYNSKVQRLDLNNMTWTDLPTIPFELGITKGVTYFPEVDSLVVVDPVYRRIYALKTGDTQWRIIAENIYKSNYHPIAEYDHVRGVVYFGGGGDTPRAFFWLNKDGTVDTLAQPPINIDLGEGGGDIVPDPVSGRLIIREHNQAEMAEYIPESNAWAMISTPIPSELTGTASSIAVPISTYGVIMYVVVRDGSASAWLYKHKQGTATPDPAPAAPKGLRIR